MSQKIIRNGLYQLALMPIAEMEFTVSRPRRGIFRSPGASSTYHNVLYDPFHGVDVRGLFVIPLPCGQDSNASDKKGQGYRVF